MTKRIAVFVACLVLLAPALAFAKSKAGKKLKAAAGQLAGVKEFLEPDDPRMEHVSSAIAEVAQEDNAEAAKTLLAVMRMPCQSASVEITLNEMCSEALAGMSSEGAHNEVRKVLGKGGKKDPELAANLCELVGSWQEPGSTKVLADLVGGKNPQVVMAAARGLGNLRLKGGISALVNVFGTWQKRGGEPINVVGQALWDITGQALKTEADWKKWWKSAKGDWDPSKRPQDTDSDTSERPKHFQKPGDPTPRIFESGLTISSKKVVIIIDVSGSMHIRTYVVEEESGEKGGEKGGGRTGLGGSGAPKLKFDPDADNHKPGPCTFSQCPGAKGSGPECPSDNKLPVYYSRMKRLTRAIQGVVRAFRGDVEFQLIAFSTDARAWKGLKLLKASAKNKEKAIKWLKGLSANGFTNSKKAFKMAFKIPQADTFIFATDGGPTNASGRPLPEKRQLKLLRTVARWNKRRKVRIDVIAIALGHNPFVSGLAEQHHGEFVTVN